MHYAKRTSIIFVISLLVFAYAPLSAVANPKSDKSMPWLLMLLSDDTSTIILSGQASLPGYRPAGQLWMIVYGVDGRVYSSGASDVRGSFMLTATIPSDLKYLLLYAIDPNAPEHHAMAFVNVLKSGAASPAGAEKSKNSDITLVDARSTAHAYVSLTSALPPAEAEVLYRNEIEALASTYLINPPNLCSVEQSPTINVPRKIISTVYGGDGSLWERVRKAQREVSTTVASGNYLIPNIASLGVGWIAGNLGVMWTRKILYDKLGPMWGRDGSLEMDSLSVTDLATAYSIITNKNGTTWGFGNCREKGIAGAFIATRFQEFKAIAFVGAEIKGHLDDHAFAIACRKSWDMESLMGMTGIPKELFESGCMIIDPWNDFTWEATPEAVKKLNWIRIVNVVTVDLPSGRTEDARIAAQKTTLDNGLGGALTAKSCEGFCEACLPYSAIASKTCKPFVIPVSGTEKRYYLFKRSGTGYRKLWAGYSEKMTGYDYFYQFISPSEAKAIKANFSKFAEATAGACKNSPAICPCPPYPDIWETGKIEVVGVFDTFDELSPYRCNNPHWGPSYLICNRWNTNTQPYPGYWPNIESACGK